MIKINVLLDDINWSKKIRRNFFFNSVCKSFPKKYRFKNKNIALTLLLSNNRKIRKLNKKFRNKDKPTDILSFPLTNKVKIKKYTYLGDIIISYNFMNAPRIKDVKIFKDRVIKTFIHGFLHLLGFDHTNEKDYKKMIKEENKIYQEVISKIN